MSDSTIEQILQQGLEHHQAGRLREAERDYRVVLLREPRHADAHAFLGIIAGQSGRPEEAVSQLRRAIEILPNHAPFHFNLAAALRQAGHEDQAIGVYQAGLALKEDPRIFVDLARIYRNRGQIAPAEQLIRRAIAIEPGSAIAHQALGSLLLEHGQYAPAADMLRRAVDLDPKDHESLRNLCLALVRLDTSLTDPRGREIAAGYLRRTIELLCSTADEWFIRGLAHLVLEEVEQANQAFHQALKINPAFLPAKMNVGISASLLGKSEEAREAYRAVVHAQPDAPLVHVSYGMSLLFAGDYKQGWQEYAWRSKLPSPNEPSRSYRQPLWRGQPLAGQRVLLYAEQGFGDTIQFVRYAPLMAHQGARIIIQAPKALVSLLKTVAGVEQVIPEEQSPPDFDLHAPMMDLAMAFGTTPETIPSQMPYLFPDPQKREQWANRLAGDENNGRPALRVGIAWSGNPQRHQNRLRSIPPRMLAPLGAVDPRISFFSLQKDAVAIDPPPTGFLLRNYMAEVNDYSETAALMANLDLILSVDTSISHMAGALALPVWTMLAVGPDWRYMAHRRDMPWYPAMRLIRQIRFNDWTPVVQQIAAMLRDRLLSLMESKQLK